MIEAKVVGWTSVAAGFRADSKLVSKVSRAIVMKYGALLETKIKGNASGRPGPNAPTGDYRRSWNTRFTSGPGLETANVGTNAPQGRRLEEGFVGIDSLGRHYSQPPFPHVGPAFQEVEPLFLAELAGKALPT